MNSAPAGIANVTDYAVLAFSRDPETAKEGLGAVLVAAFKLMAEDSFPDEVPVLATGVQPSVSPERAAELVSEHKSIRAAAKMTGYSKDALRRALLKANAE